MGGTGAQQGHKGTQCLSQRSTMPMSRIKPYRPPRPTIRELMEGRPAGEDEGGVPPKGCLGRPPRSAYRSEDRAEAQRRVRARQIQPWRGEDQRRAHGAGEQHQEGGQETEGRGGWRREKEDKCTSTQAKRLGRGGGAPTWHGRGPPRAPPQDGGGTGREHRTEPR